ncbi:MAG: transcription factor E [Candidatus Wukongarchaeota archaeon]|nr:transcription factor E [Candidatus Wukongarchaeota archaeon]
MTSLFSIVETLDGLAREVAGEEGVKVVKLLAQKSSMTDEELAQKTELNLNKIRKVLYRLYDARLATYRRVRDSETGWFVYYWQLEKNKIYEFASRKTRLVIKVLKQRLNFEENNVFFECGNESCRRLNFDEAFDVGFTCQNCGAPLTQIDNSQIIEALKKEIRKLEKSLEEK